MRPVKAKAASPAIDRRGAVDLIEVVAKPKRNREEVVVHSIHQQASNFRCYDARNHHYLNDETFLSIDDARAMRDSMGDRSKDILVLWDTPDEPISAPEKAKFIEY